MTTSFLAALASGREQDAQRREAGRGSMLIVGVHGYELDGELPCVVGENLQTSDLVRVWLYDIPQKADKKRSEVADYAGHSKKAVKPGGVIAFESAFVDSEGPDRHGITTMRARWGNTLSHHAEEAEVPIGYTCLRYLPAKPGQSAAWAADVLYLPLAQQITSQADLEQAVLDAFSRLGKPSLVVRANDGENADFVVLSPRYSVSSVGVRAALTPDESLDYLFSHNLAFQNLCLALKDPNASGIVEAFPSERVYLGTDSVQRFEKMTAGKGNPADKFITADGPPGWAEACVALRRFPDGGAFMTDCFRVDEQSSVLSLKEVPTAFFGVSQTNTMVAAAVPPPPAFDDIDLDQALGMTGDGSQDQRMVDAAAGDYVGLTHPPVDESSLPQYETPVRRLSERRVAPSEPTAAVRVAPASFDRAAPPAPTAARTTASQVPGRSAPPAHTTQQAAAAAPARTTASQVPARTTAPAPTPAPNAAPAAPTRAGEFRQRLRMS